MSVRSEEINAFYLAHSFLNEFGNPQKKHTKRDIDNFKKTALVILRRLPVPASCEIHWKEGEREKE